jgi:hypothetical protein
MAKAAFRQRFVIMLDDWFDVFSPHHFPITAQAATIDPLRRIGQHNGRFTLIPTAGIVAAIIERKDLRNAVTGQIDRGAIYRLFADEE